VVPSSCIVFRVSFLGRVVQIVVLGYFVRVGPQVHGRSKDTCVEVHGCNEDSHTWGHMSEENRCAFDACLFEVQLCTCEQLCSEQCMNVHLWV
jgi:hypothetical protein